MDDAQPVSPSRALGLLAHGVIAAVALSLGLCLFGIPVQVSDCLGNLFQVVGQPLDDIFIAQATNHSFFRPLMWPPYELVRRLVPDAVTAGFKSVHVLQVLALLLVFLRLVPVRRPLDLAILPIGVAALVGSPTFAGTLREAFPINHFLTIALCATAAAALAAGPYRRRHDLYAIALFAGASLTLESGLLVWVVLGAGYLLGWRGVSGKAVAVITVGVCAYAAVRLWLGTGAPGLSEREIGFGFGSLAPDAVAARFGGQPLPLYAYNVASALSTLLFAEPRRGTWSLVRSLMEGSWDPWMLVNTLCATGSTAVVGWYLWRRWPDWRQAARRSDEDRVVLLWPVVGLANACFCYVYLKDVVLSPAGVFGAAAVCVALRAAVAEVTWRPASVRTRVAAVALVLLSCGWAVKFVGIHYSLQRTGLGVRREWASVDVWLEGQAIAVDTPVKRALKDQLERDALSRPAPRPWPDARWTRTLFDETQ